VKRELFLDDLNIARMERLRRVLHQPRKHSANPLLRADRPWENMVSVYGTTLYDHRAGRFRMWYLAGCPADGEFTDEATGNRYPYPQTTKVAYAESADGITWDKPNLGQVEWRGSRDNNMLALGRQNAEGVSVLVDEHDPDPARRYKALFWDHAADGAYYHQDLKRILWRETQESDGAYLAWSADGIQWTHAPHNPVIRAYMDTNQNLLWDERIARYVAFSRFGFGRKIARSESEDFVHWTAPQLVLDCDEADGEGTQFYGAGVDLYEGLYVAMLWAYREGGDGRIDTQLGVSRDGVHWERVADRAVFIPLGESGSWEDGMARGAERIIRVPPAGGSARINGVPSSAGGAQRIGGVASAATGSARPGETGDELWIYYAGVNGPHSGPKFPAESIVRKHKPAIGLATLRRDGFVSLDAGADGGWLLTRASALPAGALHLNVNAAGGSCVVALCDEDGRGIAGFEQSRPIAGDHLDVEVDWPQGRALPVGHAALRISLTNASLYSYWLG